MTTFDTIPVGICNCFLLWGDKGIVLIDAGAINQSQSFDDGLLRLGVSATDVKAVVITHGHADHVGTAAYIKSRTKAPFIVHRRDAPWLSHSRPPLPPGITAWGTIMIHLAQRLWLPRINLTTVEPDEVLPETESEWSLEKWGIDGKIIATPGHSPGSISVLLDSGEAFVGDMAMNLWWLRLRPGPPIFASDVEQMKASWRTILDRGAQVIYPAHGNPFPADVMRRFL